MALRDDSILVGCKDKAYHHAYISGIFWPQLPVVLEIEHYGNSVSRGCWEDGSLFLRAIEEYRAAYPLTVQPGQNLTVKLTVRNTGSAPLYLDWPVVVGLLDPATKKPVWSASLAGVDVRKWLPGEDWDSTAFAYRRPAVPHHNEGHATLPRDIKPGSHVLALSILGRQGGMMPSARFAIENYFRGGWHPLGFIGKAPEEASLKHLAFDSPAFDDSPFYKVPEKLRAVKAPRMPEVKAVTP